MNILDAIDFLKSGKFEEYFWINIWIDGEREGDQPRQKALFRISSGRGFDVWFDYIEPRPINLTADIEGNWEWALWTRQKGGPPIAMEAPAGFGRAGTGRESRNGAGDIIRLTSREWPS